MKPGYSGPCRLVKALMPDGLWMHGLVFQPDDAVPANETGLLHIHGLAGNFYENEFIPELSASLASSGFTMYSVSTRGRDYESDFMMEYTGGRREVRIGSAREAMCESPRDIQGWIDAMKAAGIRDIILQGHSLGTLKVAKYLAGSPDPAVKGCILLSPADMFGIQRESLGTLESWEGTLALARSMAARGEGGCYLPEGSFLTPTTAYAYLEKYDGSEWDIFPIEDELLGKAPSWEDVRNIRVPVLVVYGTIDEAVVGNKVPEALEVLQSVLGPGSTVHCISGADHLYRGKESELALTVRGWVRGVCGV